MANIPINLEKVAGAGFTDITAYLAKVTYDFSISWDDVVWLKSITKLPIILKGILTAEDAVKAVDHGAAGIVVSNHGGRQLDTVPATLEALPAIVNSIGNKPCEIYLDGGIRTGTDALKAIALGAKMVFVGRPTLWALSVGGMDGVRKMLSMFQNEFDSAMALTGRRTVAEITHRLIKTPGDCCCGCNCSKESSLKNSKL